MSPKDAIIHIVEEIDAKLFGCADKRLKGIPSLDPIAGACLQAHVALTDPLSGSQFSGIVVQENFGMGKDHEQRFFLCQRPRFALIQLSIATRACKEVIKLGPQSMSSGLVWMQPIDQQLAVEEPEALAEVFQDVAMGKEAWLEALVVAEFMDPAQRQLCGERVELGSVVAE